MTPKVKADGTPWAFDSKQDVMVDDFYHDDARRTVAPGFDSGFSLRQSAHKPPRGQWRQCNLQICKCLREKGR